MKPVQFQDFLRSEDVRQRSWQQWFEHGHGLLEARPNAGHHAVASLVERGVVSVVITQNVDNLHQASGIPVHQVIELNGNATYARCLDCGVQRDLDAIASEFHSTGRVGPCRDCGGIVKTATISFGQMMPEEPMPTEFVPEAEADFDDGSEPVETEEVYVILPEDDTNDIPVVETESVEDLEAAAGPNRPVAVSRELTKKFETYHRGTAEALHAHFSTHPPKGEIVLLLAPPQAR